MGSGHQRKASGTWFATGPRWISRTKRRWPVTRKMFPFDDVSMTITMTSHGSNVVSNPRSFDCLLNSLCEPQSKKHYSPHYWPFVTGIHQWPVNSLHIRPRIRKSFHFMTSSSTGKLCYCFRITNDQSCYHMTNLSYWCRDKRRHFADHIFKFISLNENIWTSINISLKFVPEGRIKNISTLVQIMAWYQTGDKPLPEPMSVCCTDTYMRHSASMSWAAGDWITSS